MSFIRKNNIFIKFIISYLILTFIILIIGVFTYTYVDNVIKEEIVDFKQSQLQSNIRELDIRINEMKSIIDNLSLNPELNELYNITKPISNQHYYKMIKFHEKLKTYSITNDFLKSLVLYIKPGDVIITTSHMDKDIKNYYEKFLLHEGMDFDYWYTNFLSKSYQGEFNSEQMIKSMEGDYDAISYAKSLPVHLNERAKALAIAYIDKNKILDHFQIDSLDNSFLLIKNNNNLLLCTENFPELSYLDNIQFFGDEKVKQIEYKDNTYLLFKNTSDENRWEYIYGLSLSKITDKVSNVKKLYILALISALFIGITVSVFFTYKNSNPVRKIIQGINKLKIDPYNQKTEYDVIQGAITKLVNDNENLKYHLDEQKPLLQMTFFEKLFKGGFLDESKLISSAEQLSIKFDSMDYYVTIIRINNLVDIEDSQVALLTCRNYIYELFNRDVKQYIYQDNKIACILGFDSKGQRKELNDKLLDLIDMLSIDMNINVIIGISNNYCLPIDLHFAFDEALKAMEYKHINNYDKIRWYSELPKVNQGYYYPLELELKFINLLKSGSIKEIEKIIQEIYIQNFVDTKLTETEISQLLWEIKGTITKLCNQGILNEQKRDLIEKLGDRIISDSTIEDIFKNITKIAEEFCIEINSQKTQANIELVNKINAFIVENYNNYDLSLTYVAQKFQIGEKYLSSFFKEQTGQNFSTYILILRMKKAEEYLRLGAMTMYEIANSVGYRNVNTFYKAFKRVYSLSPSEHRENITN